MSDCVNLSYCGFIRKYEAHKAELVRECVDVYCKGSRQDDCIRKKYKKENGILPIDDMLPNGMTISE